MQRDIRQGSTLKELRIGQEDKIRKPEKMTQQKDLTGQCMRQTVGRRMDNCCGMFTEGFIQKVVLEGPYPMGGKGGNFQKKTPAYPEILIME